MPNYKDAKNNLYFLDDAKDEHYLPFGCTPITPAEAEAIRAPAPLTIEQKRALIPPVAATEFRFALDQLGLLEKVNAAVAMDDKKLKIEWEFNAEFARDDANLMDTLHAIGLGEVEIDNLFNLGATL